MLRWPLTGTLQHSWLALTEIQARWSREIEGSKLRAQLPKRIVPTSRKITFHWTNATKPIQLCTRQWFIQWILILLFVLSFPWWCIRGYCDHVSTPKQEYESLSYFRIHKFMDYFARDIVGISAYDFYHANDVTAIQGHHAKCKQPLCCLVFCSSASGPGNDRSKGTLHAVYLK